MQRIARAHSALVLVDYQQRLMPAIHAADAVLAEAMCLGRIAQALGVPAIATEQNPAGLGPNVPALTALCASTVAKMHFDACADGLLPALHAAQPALCEVVMAGCEAHVCLLQTALGLLRAGLRVWVVAPACGSRSAQDKALAMQRLQQAGAVLVSLEMVAFEWLDSCQVADFKPVLALLKARGVPQPAL